MKDKELLETIVQDRNLSKRTRTNYKVSIEKYTRLNKKSMSELIEEAETEEENRIRWKKRTIRKRLINYRNHLLKNYRYNTAKNNFICILTIYKHYEIEIFDIPKASGINIRKTKPLLYDDLPTKNMLQEIITQSRFHDRAIISFMIASGCAKREACNITIEDFINATSKYHNDCSDIFDVVAQLSRVPEVIPTFYVNRQKTNHDYITFCTNEAVKYLLSSLFCRVEPKPSDSMIKYSYGYVGKMFNDINKKFDFGTVGDNGYNRFRPHMLRKYHASQLKKNGASIDFINGLQGRKRNKINETYFLDDPEQLKEEYMKYMDCLYIFDTVDKSDYDLLVEENKHLNEINNRLDILESAFNHLSNEELKCVDRLLSNGDG